MVKVVYAGEKEKRGIEVGDIFVVNDDTFLQLIEIGDSFALLNIEESTLEKWDINHVSHAINYIKRDYGNFSIINSERIEINIK